MGGKQQWTRGDRTKLATLAGIKPQYLCDIISGRKAARALLAVRLEAAARELGYDISRSEWAFLDMRAGNPLFKQAA